MAYLEKKREGENQTEKGASTQKVPSEING